MTRSDCRMIAEELYKLLGNDIKQRMTKAITAQQDEWLSTEEAARMMGVSISYIKQNDIPHSKVGRLNRYRKSDIQKLMER